jgi:hypothetical protein
MKANGNDTLLRAAEQAGGAATRNVPVRRSERQQICMTDAEVPEFAVS